MPDPFDPADETGEGPLLPDPDLWPGKE